MTAKTTRKPPTPPTNGPAPAAAPAPAIDIIGWNRSPADSKRTPALDVLFELAAATEPMTHGGNMARGTTLISLVKRGIASKDDKAGTYTITDSGRALALLLWPEIRGDAKPAPKRARKAPAKADDTAKEDSK